MTMVRAALRLLACAALPLALAACDDDPAEPAGCDFAALPLAGAANAPVVTAVSLEVQAGLVVLEATATDPQGTANLLDVTQTAEVYPDAQCRGTPIVLTDDLVGSGVEETFGTVVDATQDPALYAAIAAAVTWPVRVDFGDANGNRTTGVVRAQVQD